MHTIVLHLRGNAKHWGEVIQRLFQVCAKASAAESTTGSENDAVGGGGIFGVTSRPEKRQLRLPIRPSPTASPPKIYMTLDPRSGKNKVLNRRGSYGLSNNGVVSSSNGAVVVKRVQSIDNSNRRKSYGGSIDDSNLTSENGSYKGYNPAGNNCRRLPVMLQFHGGGFVSGSNDSVANDYFCRRIAKLCDVIVLAVGYRLAPENKYPAAFDDGLKVLHWLAKQANLAECSKSLGTGGGADSRKSESSWHVADAFGASMVEPWLAAHGDPSRKVTTPINDESSNLARVVVCTSWVSCGGNIADYVTRKAVEAGKLLDPVKVVAQVLMYPFFNGSGPKQAEEKLFNSYFYDKAMCELAWKVFLPEEEFNLDHPAANPLVPNRAGPPLKQMPPTLTVVAEHDWMRDRAIAYSEELRKVKVDAPVLEYKDAVHEFATLDMLLKTPQAQACAEDIAIWVKKYISLRGYEFSY
ncbi:putative carboxylesterase 16 [Sesamum angolense]|uniref:Carboxylesterase 16 n=1 Tax=Sesamum angolense TaxID=2727404 RepID=A0AAE2BPF7_9LAMI|nr:putative carboxylesterase 16 [Sesamum angolense]